MYSNRRDRDPNFADAFVLYSSMYCLMFLFNSVAKYRSMSTLVTHSIQSLNARC